MATIGFESKLRFVYPTKIIEGPVTFSHDGNKVVFQVEIANIEGGDDIARFFESGEEFLEIKKGVKLDSLDARQHALALLLNPVLQAAGANWALGLAWMDRSPQGMAAADNTGGLVRVGSDQSSIYEVPSGLESEVIVLFPQT